MVILISKDAEKYAEENSKIDVFGEWFADSIIGPEARFEPRHHDSRVQFLTL